jgi:hypothetical protein
VTVEDLSKPGLRRKAPGWWGVFSPLRDMVELQVTDNRLDSLAAKRKEKRNIVSRELPPLTSQLPTTWKGPRSSEPAEPGRIVSISEPTKDSGGSKLFYACHEKDSDAMGNQFCETSIEALFDQHPPLKWVTGRPKVPVLQWQRRYVQFPLI